MKAIRAVSWTVILVVGISCLFAAAIAPHHYAHQDREAASQPPSRQYLLGTDELGRDRFSRLLYGSRVSLTLAPAASFLSVLLALLIGGVGGYVGGWWGAIADRLTDLFLSMPWLFLLVTVRAVMPLNVSPFLSATVTFLLLGLLGWSAAARVLSRRAGEVRRSLYLLQAQASGVRGWRLFVFHVSPNLWPVLVAQFWVAIPLYILAEANLGLLGLGVSEPLPSWGGMLRELESYPVAPEEPWRFAVLMVLVLVVSSFQFVLPETAIDEERF